MNNTDEQIICVKCQNEIGLIDGDVPNGTLEIPSPMLDTIYICKECRYFGATVKFLQWGLNPNKMSVDIIGALESTKRYCSNIRQYIGDLRIMVGLNHERTKDIYATLTHLENIANAVEANENVAISELMEFGK